jgi:MFS family permease
VVEYRSASDSKEAVPWYSGLTRYQWIVLAIASLGWIFDVFEGQIFVASMNEAMPSLLPASATAGDREFFNKVALGAFLLGGALGGVLFGTLGDRIGRKRTLNLTILAYSVFTFASAFSTAWWHLAGFRFLVAMGVGGEWAVASSIVAEVFPKRARAWSLGIFHASSVLGTYLAILAGLVVLANPHAVLRLAVLDVEFRGWRLGFMLGAIPALLVIWVRLSLREPETWQRARSAATSDPACRLGGFPELFAPSLRSRTVVGVMLAAIGLATFWGVHVYGKDLLRRDMAARYLPRAGSNPTENLDDVFRVVRARLAEDVPDDSLAPALQIVRHAFMIQDYRAVGINSITPTDIDAGLIERVMTATRSEIDRRLKRWEMLGMLLVTTGGGLGLVSFGPLCEQLGRRGAFVLFHLGGLAAGVAVFLFVSGPTVLCVTLPVFGFLTLGMHAGYAIYFPELFPTRLRSTGSGFCFNVGRLIAAPVLVVAGWLQRSPENGGLGVSLELSGALLALLFLLGPVVLRFAPETRGQDLPE